jgi:integrase
MTNYVFKHKRRIKGKTVTARTYSGRYRLAGDFRPTTVALGVTDKQVAEQNLNQLVRRLEMERAGIIAPKVQRDAAQKPLENHLADYLADLRGRELSSGYVYNVEKRLYRLFRECDWQIPADATGDSFVAWRARSTAAAKTKNQYLEACSSFFAWLRSMKRVLTNPLETVSRVAEEGNERRKRRAYEDEQLRAILAIAGPFRVGYLAAVDTGFRRGELKKLTWHNFMLEGNTPHVWLERGTKNRKRADLPLHPELVTELKRIKPADAQPTDFVFSNQNLPSMHMVRKHLEKAGIPYKDEDGRQFDFHALRHTLATNLAKSNVQPRVAMEMMRHSDIRLTLKTYTDSTRLPLMAALDGLPIFLPTDGDERKAGEATTEQRTQMRTQDTDVLGRDVARCGTRAGNEELTQLSGNDALGHELACSDTTMRDSEMAALLGLEPRQADSESAVLPLHHKAKAGRET